MTGSNKGIGYAVVMKLCAELPGAIVYLTSRDESRGLKAVEELGKLGLHPAYHQLDIDDESSVLKLRDHLVAAHGGFDVLVNNAAIIFPMTTPKELFAQSVRKTIDTNFYNTLRVCDILFPILRPHARVVNLTSDDGHLLKISGREPEASLLRGKFASPQLTVAELCQLMEDFVEYLNLIYSCILKELVVILFDWQCGRKGRLFRTRMAQQRCRKRRLVAQRRLHCKDLLADLISININKSFTFQVSKVGISALTRIQQRQFDADPREDMAVNCVHPGYVKTDATYQKGEKTIEEGTNKIQFKIISTLA